MNSFLYIPILIHNIHNKYLGYITIFTFLCISENLALNKPSKQKDTYWDYIKGFNYSPKYGNDGNYTTRSVTSSNKGWWTVNLEKRAKITKINVYMDLGYAYSTGKYRQMRVLTKANTNDEWTLCKYIANPAKISPLVIHCDRATSAQYVKISMKGNVYFFEVEAWGQY